MCVRVLTTKTKITIGVVKIFWASLISAGAHYLRIILFYSWRVCRRKSQMKWWTCKSEAQRATVPPSFILSVDALGKKTPLDLDVSMYYPIRVGVALHWPKWARTKIDIIECVRRNNFDIIPFKPKVVSVSHDPLTHTTFDHFQPVQLFSALWKPYHAERYKPMVFCLAAVWFGLARAPTPHHTTTRSYVCHLFVANQICVTFC